MYKFDVLEIEGFEIIKTKEKSYYNSDGLLSLSEWVEKNTPKTKKSNFFPNFSSPLKVKETSSRKISEPFLGWFSCGTNTIERNSIDVGIFSAPYSHKGTSGFQIYELNFFKTLAAFSVRSLTKMNWMNEKDLYLSPSLDDDKYNSFQIDSLVISIFANASNQSSLRQIEYKDKLWDIKNEFFWMSVDKMKELADQKGYDELYNDARTSPDRYVYKLLFGKERIYDELSTDAKAVLDKATEIVEKSMELRQVMANDENHLNSWDAGYAQLKLVWKEYFQEDFKEFRQLYKSLEDRMRPLVYELGFLLK